MHFVTPHNIQRPMKSLILHPSGLTFSAVRYFLEENPKVVLSSGAKKQIQSARKFVESKLKEEGHYYGINTGFGKLATQTIPAGQLSLLQENIVYSHAMAVGEPVPEPLARLILLLHASSLAQGYSGVRTEIVEGLFGLLNHHITPVIPEKGSLGASGDLALLGHVALSLMGGGEVFYRGKRVQTQVALKKVGLKPIRLEAKEGLSLVNGLSASLAYALHGFFHAERLIKLADITAAASIEGDQGSFQPFDEKVLRQKAHKGVLDTGINLRHLLQKSEINLQHAHCGRVQDPYSFRCVPQVHGAARDVYHFVKTTLEKELSSVTDNPLVFVRAGQILSGGNFHGEALSFASDFLSIALTELGALSERRLSVLLNPICAEIPTTFLTTDPGLHSGLMAAHYVVTNLALENKSLSQPASIDSLPTSGNQEDHVSQSCFAAQKLCKVAENLEKILGVELWAATRALKLVANGHKPGKGVYAIWQAVSQKIPKSLDDRFLREGLDAVLRFVSQEAPIRIVEAAVGKLKI